MFRRTFLAAALALTVVGGLAASHEHSHNSWNNGDSSYYTNSSGHRVHRPVFSDKKPDGATAKCADGSYSFSQHRRGTCSYHGGVIQWY